VSKETSNNNLLMVKPSMTLPEHHVLTTLLNLLHSLPKPMLMPLNSPEWPTLMDQPLTQEDKN
jgi:hypothetical protein